MAILRGHKTHWGWWRAPQFVGAQGNNVWYVTERLFAAGGRQSVARWSQFWFKLVKMLWAPWDFIKLTGAGGGHHSSLWSKATMFNISQRGYLWPEATKGLPVCLNIDWNFSIVVAAQRLHKTFWDVRNPPQFNKSQRGYSLVSANCALIVYKCVALTRSSS